ncbi:MAG TPA: HNH endonuclease [Sedimentisphaerales bacterium]|nr:HNH endonuclease [Sedimentisphaerales bacterium]
MSCKPDIQTTDEMHKLYQDGFSLAQVAKAFGVTRQTVYKRFERRSLPLRDNRKPLPFIFFKGHRYTRRTSGYYARTNGKRDLLHRAIWKWVSMQAIPKGWDVHHIDGDKTNNDFLNLHLMRKSDHSRLHSTK